MGRLQALVVAAVFLCGTSALLAAEEKGVRRVPIEKQKVDPPPRDPPRTAPPAKPDNITLPPSSIPRNPDPPRGSTDTYRTPPSAPPDRGDRGCRGAPNCSERFDGGKK